MFFLKYFFKTFVLLFITNNKQMDINNFTEQFSPAQLKSLIEKIEIIPEKELGLMIADSGWDYTSFWIFKEGYKNFSTSEIRLILICFKKSFFLVSMKRQYNQYSDGLNSKRLILDCLYSYRLLLEPNQVIRNLVNTTQQIFDSTREHPNKVYACPKPEVIKCLVTIFSVYDVFNRATFNGIEKEEFITYLERKRSIRSGGYVNWDIYDEDDIKRIYEKLVWKKCTN